MSVPSSQPHPLGPPQFGLRTLLLAVSTFAVLLGLWQWMSPITFAALLLLLLTIVAHVAGNVIGSRLRDGRQRVGSAVPPVQHEHTTALEDHHFAPVSKLGRNLSLGWIPVSSAIIGGLIGAAGGGLWTAWMLQRNFDWFPVGIAIVAFGALGGFGGFLVVGFGKALGDAWHEAANARHVTESPVSKNDLE